MSEITETDITKEEKTMNDIDKEIQDALDADMRKDMPYFLKDRVWDWIKYRHDIRLNNPAWLAQFYYPKDIAQVVGCSEHFALKKMKQYGLTDYYAMIFGLNTSAFHYGKRFAALLARPHIKKIEQGIDSVYARTRSKNAQIFKDIISDLEFYDQDNGAEEYTAKMFGMTRKALIVLAAKFLICLYEYDSHYSERIDYVLGRVLKAKDDFYLDETRNPHNWFPHRDMRKSARYMVLRNKK